MPSWVCWALGMACLVVGAYICAGAGYAIAREALPGGALGFMVGVIVIGVGAMLWRVA